MNQRDDEKEDLVKQLTVKQIEDLRDTFWHGKPKNSALTAIEFESLSLLCDMALASLSRQQPTAEDALAEQGVFAGHHGLRGLAKADAFWAEQPYGTRLYYGSGAQYLHRSVLQAAIDALDQAASRLSALSKPQKWCEYCRVSSHNDAECWCTRPADWHLHSWKKVEGGFERHDKPQVRVSEAALREAELQLRYIPGHVLAKEVKRVAEELRGGKS